jgi:hypothetical protein
MSKTSKEEMNPMKKILVVLIAVVALAGFSTLGLAQSAKSTTSKVTKHVTEAIKGKIVSIDTAKNEIVVKEDMTGVEKTIAVSPKKIAALKVGEEVKVKEHSWGSVVESVKKPA